MTPSLRLWPALPGSCLSPSLLVGSQDSGRKGQGRSPRDIRACASEQSVDSWLCDWRSEPLRILFSFQSKQCKIETQHRFSGLFWDPGCWHSLKVVFSWISEARGPFCFKSLESNIGFLKGWQQFLQFPPKSLTWISSAWVINASAKHMPHE